MYFFRAQQGLEVDFLVPRPNAGLWPIEAKASKTVRPAVAGALLALGKSLGDRAKRLTVVHRRSSSDVANTAIAPGVEALDIDRLVGEINAR